MLNQEEFASRINIQSCKNWIKIKNSEDDDNIKSINNIKDIIKLNINKCIKIPKNNFLSVESKNSNIILVNKNKINKSLEFCAKRNGSTILTFLPVDEGAEFNILVKVTNYNVQNKKLKFKQKNSNKQKNSEQFLTEKLFPGWR
jgi:hypothetical protein